METPVKGFVFCITKPHILKLGQGKNKHMHHHQAAVGTCLLVSAVYWPSTSTDKTEHEDHPTSYSMGTGGGSFPTDQLGYKTAQSPPATSFKFHFNTNLPYMHVSQMATTFQYLNEKIR